jgi:hypothetical protein
MTLTDTIASKEIVSLTIVMHMHLITYRDLRRDARIRPAPHPIHNPVGQVDTKNGLRWMESAVPI